MSAKYRKQLPQLSTDFFLTDGGIETTLIFHDGLELPLFAAFDLFKSEEGRAALVKYFKSYAEIARENNIGIVLETATWRASNGWGAQLDYSPEQIKQVNLEAVAMLLKIRDEYETVKTTVVISGCIGPQGDGYNPDTMLSAEEAERYHSEQIKTFAESDADMVTAITMTYPEEAIGISRAAKSLGMPVVISFTVETDGKLPSGYTLKEAIEAVDVATDSTPEYYMINCAHPTHFDQALANGEVWVERIRGLRANASRLSHAELDESEELDEGNPEEFGQLHKELHQRLDHLTVFGGCCGTDHRHIAEISKAILTPIQDM